MTRKLPVDLDEVVQAMEHRDRDMMDWFLDTQTGRVLLVSDQYGLEDMDEDEFNAFPPKLREEQEDSWRVLNDDAGRYEPILTVKSHQAYDVMERFINRVADARAARELEQAIAGKGAFRRFKDALFGYPALREEWFQFETQVKRQWARDWLEELGIESTWQPSAPPRKPPQPPEIIGLDHAQITVPKNQEQAARRFYCDVLKMKEILKPPSLQDRGGVWLAAGDLQLHVGVEDGVQRSATKAHLAYHVNDLAAWAERLRKHDVQILDSIPIPGFRRFEFRDPFGNRVEMIQPGIERH